MPNMYEDFMAQESARKRHEFDLELARRAKMKRAGKDMSTLTRITQAPGTRITGVQQSTTPVGKLMAAPFRVIDAAQDAWRETQYVSNSGQVMPGNPNRNSFRSVTRFLDPQGSDKGLLGVRFRNGPNLSDKIGNNIVAPFINGVIAAPATAVRGISYLGQLFGKDPKQYQAAIELFDRMSEKLQSPYDRYTAGHLAGGIVSGNAPLIGDATAQIASGLAGRLYGLGLNPAVKGSKLVSLTSRLPTKVQPVARPAARAAQLAASTATMGTLAPETRAFVQSAHSPLYTDILPGSISQNRDRVMNFPGVQTGLSFLDWAGNNKATLAYKKALNKHVIMPIAKKTLSSEYMGKQFGSDLRAGLNRSPEYWDQLQSDVKTGGTHVWNAYRQQGTDAAVDTLTELFDQHVSPFARDVYKARMQEYLKNKPQEIVADRVKGVVPTFGTAPDFFRGFVSGAVPEIPRQYQPAAANVLWNAPSAYQVLDTLSTIHSSMNN